MLWDVHLVELSEARDENRQANNTADLVGRLDVHGACGGAAAAVVVLVMVAA
jgi:hypothetical protein